jgi:uncharacterized protein (TIGR02757 family)
MLELNEIRDFLNEKVLQYNHPDFLNGDPVQIPHMYTKKEDIEIAGFLTAVISWGNRASILRRARYMMDLMGDSPYEFVINHKAKHLERVSGAVHRTFQAEDLIYFLRALKYLYLEKDGLEGIFREHQSATSLQPAIHHLKRKFFALEHLPRTEKHLPDPLSGSAAKRINMFLRWMVRQDRAGVDFGIWQEIPPSSLSCPLDVHTGNVARKLGLLKRRQNDAKAVLELDEVLRSFDPDDPVKYDFALFGLGIFEKL